MMSASGETEILVDLKKKGGKERREEGKKRRKRKKNLQMECPVENAIKH